MKPITFLSAQDLNNPALIPHSIEALRRVFLALLGFGLKMPERTLLITADDPQQNQMLVSPIAWPAESIACVKITTLTSANRDRDLDLIQGLVILLDLVDGCPKAIMDGGALTALRTGATVGLATDLLCPSSACRLSVIGSGTQARAAVDAILTVRAIKQIHLASRNKTRAEVFASWIHDRWGQKIDVHVHDRIQSAVADADIILTATSTDSAVPIIKADWGSEKAFYAVIGGANENACEIDPVLLKNAVVVVETSDGALAEAGEVRAALKSGYLRKQDLIELGTIVAEPSLLNNVHRRVIFRTVGNAAEDLAVASAVLDMYETGRI